MPTEDKRSITSPTSTTNAKDNNVIIPRLEEQHQQYPSKQQLQELTQLSIEEREQQHRPHHNSKLNLTMEIDNMSTSQTSTTSSNASCNGSKKTTIASADPTAYVAKARVTRPTPPPPPYNPMQFVQIKPCNLYQTAQEQLKKAEEVKKIQEIRKEEPEDWQNNLDNWKSSRRKRVEHIIDRVVEVKKLEMEEHDRTRRKSKTFSEMIEERGERAGRSLNKLASLAVYNEDESNDLSDLGIGTSSASGKSSLSEDCDNNSAISDNVVEFETAIMVTSQKSAKNSTTREYISSPGYETSSSTAPASSPDPCEYTYEGAIQDYKQRVSRAACGLMALSLNKITVNNTSNGIVHSKESTPERSSNGSQNGNAGFKEIYPPRRGSKIEDRLIGFEVQSPSEECVEQKKVDVPKIDISKRKEIFENQQQLAQQYVPKSQGVLANTESGTSAAMQRVSLLDRFKVQDNHSELSEFNRKDNKCSSGEITSIKDRLQSLEQKKQNLVKSGNSLTKSSIVDIPVPPLKERLSSLQSAVAKEEVRKPPVALVDARQLEIMKNEDEKAKQALREVSRSEINNEYVKATNDNELERGDSRVHSADNIEVDNRGLQVEQLQKQQEHKLHAAIEALALEEQQLAAAANVVNQIEAEFEELSLGSVALAPLPTAVSSSPIPVATTSPSTNETMEYSPISYILYMYINNYESSLICLITAHQCLSITIIKINEALELALAAIDQESKRTESLIIEGVSATITTTATTTTMLPSATVNTSSNAEILINKTDEEKVENLQYLQTNEIFCQQRQHEEKGEGLLKSVSSIEEEKTEEEISKEPIYENVNPVTALSRVSQNIPSTTSKSLISNSNDQISIIMNNNNNNSVINSNNESYDSQTNKINHNYNSTIVGLTNNAFANPMAKIEMDALTTTAAATAAAAATITANALITIAATVNVTGTTTIATTTTASSTTVTTNNSTNNLQLITQAKETTFNEISKNPKQNCTALKTFNEPTMNPTITANTHTETAIDLEPYYQVPKSCEPYYDAPKHLKPIPVYENIEMFFNASANNELSSLENSATLEPPKEKPPPPPCESPPPIDELDAQTDAYSSDNTYETLTRHQHHYHHHHHHHSNHLLQSPSGLIDHQHLPHSPPIKRMNSTKRIKKELRNKRSSFLGIEGSNLEDDETYLELTVAPPPDMAQLLQEERRLEKQLYLKAGLCDSSDTGESRDSGVSENHSRQSSEHYTNSSEENDSHDVSTSPLTLETQSPSDPPASELIYQNDGLLQVAPTPLLQTVKGNSAESWTESATVAAAATKSLTEATATANAKMMSIEEKIREQEEVLRVERELLQLEQEELKRQRENLMLRENIARRELQHGAKMLMSANRRSLQDLNGLKEHNVSINADNVNLDSLKGSGLESAYLEPRGQAVVLSHHYAGKMLPPQPQHSQQIYANISNLQQQYYHMDTDYRKSMSDINEFSKCMIAPPMPPSKPMRATHVNVGSDQLEFGTRQTHSLNTQQFGGSLVKIAQPVTPCRGTIYSNYLHQSAQNLNTSTALATHKKDSVTSTTSMNNSQPMYPGHMSRNTLHALSAAPKPKYTDGWVQVQNRKSIDSNLANDSAWLSAYQQKRKSMPDAYGSGSNQWLVNEQPHAQFKRSTISSNNTALHQSMNGSTKLTNGLTTATATSTVSSSSAINNGKPLPDSIIQTLTERVQSKGLGERKRNHLDKSPLPGISTFHQHPYPSGSKMTPTHLNAANPQQASAMLTGTSQRSISHRVNTNGQSATATSSSSPSTATTQDKVLSVSGKKKCSHCGEELGKLCIYIGYLGCSPEKCRHIHRELKYIVWV
ncbi:uncharacterized protein ACN427_014039 isoform 2-T9 [Glossina fuscipes fuscipes]